MKKIVLIHNIVTPTRTLLFNKMNEKFKKQGYDFKIIFTSATESNREWDIQPEIDKFEFEYEILEGKQIKSKSKKDKHFFHLNFDIKKVLEKENPDIIIHAGWAGLSVFMSCHWSGKNKKKFILWSGSTVYEKSWRRVVTKPLVKWIVRNSDSYWSYGTRASEYLVTLGANNDRIFKLYNTVDIDFFVKQYEELKKRKEEFKKKFSIDTKYILLYVGQLVERKGVYEILEGFARFQKKNKDLSLVLVGNGKSKSKMKEIIQEQNIENVIFTGYIQKTDISKYFVMADIFTLPSYEEVWGLVINEAMCFGLPILTTNSVGASVDLVQEGKNGYIMKENTSCEFEKGLDYIFEKGLIKKNNSSNIIQEFTVDRILEDLEF